MTKTHTDFHNNFKFTIFCPFAIYGCPYENLDLRNSFQYLKSCFWSAEICSFFSVDLKSNIINWIEDHVASGNLHSKKVYRAH